VIRIAVAAVLLVLLAGTHWKAYHEGLVAGQAEVQQRYDKRMAEIAEAHAAELERARKRQAELQDVADRLRQEKRDEAKRITARYELVIDGLRDRPQARAGASGVPLAAGTGVGCTGAGLARPDGEFLAGYAADVARLQSALNTCRVAYDAARNRTPHAQ
jgi:hypothetical protein